MTGLDLEPGLDDDIGDDLLRLACLFHVIPCWRPNPG